MAFDLAVDLFPDDLAQVFADNVRRAKTEKIRVALVGEEVAEVLVIRDGHGRNVVGEQAQFLFTPSQCPPLGGSCFGCRLRLLDLPDQHANCDNGKQYDEHRSKEGSLLQLFRLRTVGGAGRSQRLGKSIESWINQLLVDELRLTEIAGLDQTELFIHSQMVSVVSLPD